MEHEASNHRLQVTRDKPSNLRRNVGREEMNKKLHPVVVVLIFAGLVLALGVIFGNLFAAAICVGMFLILGLFISGLNRLEAWDARRRGRDVGLSPRTVVIVFSTVAVVMTTICWFAGGWILAVSVPLGILAFLIVTILFRMVLGLPLLLIDAFQGRRNTSTQEIGQPEVGQVSSEAAPSAHPNEPLT